MVARTMGKNAARKIRKIVEASPTPNQRMAKGIQAREDRLRKKFTMGRRARRGVSFCPNQTPIGIPEATAIKNPQLTRNSETMRSLASLPVRISSPNARTTAKGEGKALSWNTPADHTSVQPAHRAARTARGKTTDFMDFCFSVISINPHENRLPRNSWFAQPLPSKRLCGGCGRFPKLPECADECTMPGESLPPRRAVGRRASARSHLEIAPAIS